MTIEDQRLGRTRTLLAVLAVMAATLAIGAPQASASVDGGAVFTISNDSSGNSVLVFERASDGTLTHVDTVATGGLGSGAGLGSQGAVTLSDDGGWLFVVNAGSDSLSLFSVNGTELDLMDVASTQGDMPVSVDVHGSAAFVVNAGSSSIEGFRVSEERLRPLPRSTRPLSGDAVGPAQIEFSPDGRSIVVTEKATNQIVTFGVRRDGRVGPGTVSPSAGETPFGFEFDPAGRLVVSEAFGGAPDASVVSTYRLDRRGETDVLDTEPTNQTAACWIAITENGAFVYTTNTGSSSVTSFRLEHDGSLTLLAQTAVGGGPIDLDFSAGDEYLYVLNGASHSISVLAAADDGSLTPIETVPGLPPAAGGMAAS